MKFKQQLPQGVSDLYSQDYKMKQHVIDKVMELTKLYGFKQIQTPTFEYYDLFVNMPGTMDTDQMIKMIDHDGKILVLRPDATIPIARMVANAPHRDVRLNKLSYVTNIFRMQNGEADIASRSFTQVGVEHFGNYNLMIDVEIITLAIESLKTVSVQNFQIDIGQASFYKSLIADTDLTIEERKLIEEKIEQKNEFELAQLLEVTSLDEEKKDVLLQLPRLFGNSDDVIKKAKKLALNDEMKDAIEELEIVVNELKVLDLDGFISLDLGIINHLNYYTGIMFQGYIHGYGKPIIQGGRYDELTEQFGLQLNAIGFGIYIDQLIHALEKLNITFHSKEKTVNIYAGNNSVKAFQYANELRKMGWITEMVYNLNTYLQGEVLIDVTQHQVVDLKNERKEGFNNLEELLQKVGKLNGSH